MDFTNSQPKVSIIVPLYNQERYFEACIRSICQQTYENIEVIVVNDGSSDHSPLIAKKYAQKDSRIIVIDKPNEGTAFARRDGYLKSTGDYIAFVDNDDLLPKNAIKSLLTHMTDNNVDLVIGSITKKLGLIHRAHIDKSYSFPYNQVIRQPELYDKYYIGFYNNSVFPVNIWGRLYRKEIIDRAYQETELFSNDMQCMAGDEYFNMKLFPFLRSMFRINEAVYLYRYGGTVNGFNRFFPEVLTLADYRLELLKHYKCDDAPKYLFDEYVACYYYHAQQLLEFKQTDKNGVIDYFKNELNNRKIVSALIDFYTNGYNSAKGVKLILERDYDGMYNYAIEMMHAHKRSLKHIVKQCLNCFFKITSDAMGILRKSVRSNM